MQSSASEDISTEKHWSKMDCERQLFYVSGPSHLTSIDWKNSDHQRSVVASLVWGVKVVELDRQEMREGPEALAPPWWDFFHFKLLRTLVDDASCSIFGAIYEFSPPFSSLCTNHSLLEDEERPHFVIAFRGTLSMYDLVSRDLNLSLKFIRNGLHKTPRFEIAMEAIRATVVEAGNSSRVWLAGHSMGSVLAMLAGKTMAKDGILLKSFLFNQPFVFAAPMERIKQQKIKQQKIKLGIRFARSVIAAGLAKALNPRWLEHEDPFLGLYEWVPSIFVNQGDDFFCGYIGYFEHRKKMQEIGAEGIERLATRNSVGSLLRYAIEDDPEPPMDLIPCANLTVNYTPSTNFKQAHGIHQWWTQNQQLQSETYRYR